MKHVYILTWCKKVENLYGATLIFKTLRVGFPNAKIHVVDNASLPACRSSIRQGAEECGAAFTQIEKQMAHHDFIEGIINTQTEATAVFVDPDICFWKNVEAWHFDAIMAGRLIPEFDCEYTGCITHPRLHTSFLWIPDVKMLRQTIQTLRTKLFEFEPFRPVMFCLQDVWHRLDTGASLFSALTTEMYAFSEEELDAYDHLFCGSHLGTVSPSLHDKYGLLFEEMHEKVKVNHLSLKGAWKLQEEYFNSRAIKTV